MEIRFKKNETRDLAMFLSETYSLRDGVNDIVFELEYAIDIARMHPDGVMITVENGMMFATLLYDEREELVGVVELVGMVVKKGGSYVYEFK